MFVSAVLLVETLFFAALAPLLPGLGDELGLSKAESGLLVAMYALAGIVFAVPGGLLASRWGVKPTVATGLLILAVTSGLFGVVDGYWPLVLTRFGQGVAGTLCWTGVLSWLVYEAPRERRGEMIGFAMSAAIGGALLGPVLGGAASHFGRAPAFSGVAVVALLLAIASTGERAPRQGPPQPARVLIRGLRDPRVLTGMWLLSLPALLFGALGVLGPLQLDRLGWGSIGVAATFLLAAAIEASISPSIGRWSDRKGRMAPIRIGLLGSAAAALLIPWAGDRYLLSALVILCSIPFGMFWTPSMALISDGAEAVGIGHGLGFALLNFAWAPGNALGSAAGGALAEAAGDAATYGLLAGICLATVAVLRARSAAFPLGDPAGLA